MFPIEDEIFARKVGAVPKDRLLRDLQQDPASQVHVVGDALEVRRILSAVHEGAEVGRQL